MLKLHKTTLIFTAVVTAAIGENHSTRPVKAMMIDIIDDIPIILAHLYSATFVRHNSQPQDHKFTKLFGREIIFEVFVSNLCEQESLAIAKMTAQCALYRPKLFTLILFTLTATILSTDCDSERM